MEFDPRDQDLVRLLKKLKDVNDEYPEQLLVARRRSFLKRMTEIGFGISGAIETRQANPSAGSPISSTLLEIALVVAIAVEASTMAYFYRAKLASFFHTSTTTSQVEQVSPPPVVSTHMESSEIPVSPVISSTAITTRSPLITRTSTGTATPKMMGGLSSTPGVNQPASTPVPDPKKGNNGNHYGQTPKPERTKENNGNNNKPPKDDGSNPPPGKPTKSK
jgi:hypothetical protein